jgi:hypothetical protein
VCRGREHLFQLGVHGRKAPIVAHLKNARAILSILENALRIGDVGREWFLTKDVFACFDGGDRYRNVLRVWSRDENCVASFEDFEDRRHRGRIVRGRKQFSMRGNDVVHGDELNALVTREHAA